MSGIIIEICCGSVDDVIEARKAGADRVELNSCMFMGGLTPSIGAMKKAREVDIDILAMVRPREGGFCYTEMEFETMLTDAQEFIAAGADGVVFGFLQQDGTINIERCRKMLDVIGNKLSVFHRAIDVTPDWRIALDELIKLGITRVLTSGQEPSVHYGAETVRKMREHAAGRIEILPGGGIKLHNVVDIITKTGANQVHCSLSKIMTDNSAMGNPSIHFGGALYPPEDRFSVTDSDKVRALVEIVGCDSRNV